ncbi:MAG TPA: quinolinate synthase NadA [Thermoleophilia bacterium]|nr:quinolinate synthase NadA [Thermoleophilia bacterium]
MADRFSERQAELRQLAAERGALILSHNYQRLEIQQAADFVGDSLELARKAAATEAETILFCGVHFMAETAHILAPHKTVLMPDPRAGCPMANMVTPERLRALKAQHPGTPVVAYVNTSAAVKAETDVCCTSSNCVEILGRFPRDQEIIFVPDRNLGDYVRRLTGRENMIIWDGYCHVHGDIRPEDIVAGREQHPDAVVMAHPECPPEVLALADAIASTSGMLRRPETDPAQTFIVATELGLIERLKMLYPGRTFVAASRRAYCPNMKLTTLEKAIAALDEGINEITVPPTIRERALRAVERMVEVH